MYKFLDGKSYLLGAQSNKKDIEQLKVDVENLKDAARGKLYNEQVLSADTYSDTAYANTVPFATLDEIGGKSLVWNNISAPLIRAHWVFEGNVTGTFNDDGSVTFTNTANNFGIRTVSTRPAVLNHKLYFGALVKSEVTSGSNIFKIGFGSSSASFVGNTTMTRCDTISNINQTTNSPVYVWYPSSTGTLTVKDLCIVDLTVMFGMGNEPADVSDPRIAMINSIFAAHPEYREPTLMDFSPDMVVSKGRNLVAGVLENANIASYGELQAHADFDMCYAPVVKGQTYTVRTNGSELVCGFFTDIPSIRLISFDGSRIVDENKTVTAPITGYIAFRTTGHYAEAQISVGTTELPYLPHREPITHDTSALVRKYFPDGMKSAGSVHDEIDLENKVAIKRVGSVDLGTLKWNTYNADRRIYLASLTGAAAYTDNNTMPNIIASKYSVVIGNVTWVNGMITMNLNSVFICDTSFDDVSSVDFNGVMLNYELDEPVITPITEDIDPYIAVEGSGTVEFHNDKGDEYLVPVAHQMTYLTKIEV